jgi:hypothetical protein
MYAVLLLAALSLVLLVLKDVIAAVEPEAGNCIICSSSIWPGRYS